jgi:hypothetical protein
MIDSSHLGRSLADIESTIAALEGLDDAETREKARAIVRGVLDLHREGLARMLEIVRAAGQGGPAPLDALGRDDLVGSLLILHGIHPVSFEDRVRSALERVRPPGWSFALGDCSERIVRVTVSPGADPARAAPVERVRTLIEGAIGEAAPDAEGLEITGGTPVGLIPAGRLVRLTSRRVLPGP